MSCKVAEIQSAAISVKNCISSIFNLIKSNIINEEEQKNIVKELYLRTSTISDMFYNAATNHYNKIDIQVRHKFIQEHVNGVASSADIMYIFGNHLITTFGETYGTISSDAWKQAIRLHIGYIKSTQNKEVNKNIIVEYSEKIKKYYPSFETPSVDTSSSPCYIATAVYGSYDCPEVWVLRRFRDNILAKTWYGKVLIKTYYTISPTVVKRFGETKWFRNTWRAYLDKFVYKLQNIGIQNTPYRDN